MNSAHKLTIAALLVAAVVFTISCSPDDPPTPTQVVNPPAQTGTKAVVIQINSGTLPADGESSVLITAVCTIDGKEAPSFLPVNFSTTRGDFSNDGVEPISDNAPTRNVRVNTSSGIAQIYLISDIEPGTASIKATFSDSVQTSASIEFVRTASELSKLELAISPSTGQSPLTSSVVVTAKDQEGEILSGVTVRLRISDKTASFDREKIKTDSNGKATTFIRNVTKDATLTATASGISATELITITNDQASSLQLTVVNNQGGLANQDPVLINNNGQLLLRATVTGSSGNVKGIAVNFSSTDGSTSFSKNPSTTNSNGQAETFANGINDDSIITANAKGVTDSVSVKINRKPVPVIRLISGEAKAGVVSVLTFSAESSYEPDLGYGDKIATFTWARTLESTVNAPITNSNTANPQLITFTIGEFGGILPADGDKLTVFLTVIDQLGLQNTATYEVTFAP